MLAAQGGAEDNERLLGLIFREVEGSHHQGETAGPSSAESYEQMDEGQLGVKLARVGASGGGG
jgi:hypothetical protein